jgi:hypothetical protein
LKDIDDEKYAQMQEKKLATIEAEKFSKEKRDKIDNYAKYVREMYWPNVSLKKQLELEHVKGTLHHKGLRSSIDDELFDADGKPIKKPNSGGYERPWRKAMKKGP